MSAPTLPTRRADRSVSPDLPIFNPFPEGPARLSALRGSPVVLTFHPTAWDPSPSGHLPLFNRLLARFLGPGEELESAFHDGVWCHMRMGGRQIRVGLVTPCHPVDARGAEGVLPGAVFLLDGEGTVRWRYFPPSAGSIPAEDVLGVLGGLAPVEDGAGDRLSREEFFGATLAAALILATRPAAGRASSRSVVQAPIVR